MPLRTGARGIVARGAPSSGTWHPSMTFLGGDKGWFHDFDIAKMSMWTDTGGTTPVTALDDAVRRFQSSLSGNTKVFTNSNNWPYKTGTYPSMQIDLNVASGLDYANAWNGASVLVYQAAIRWANTGGNKGLIRTGKSGGGDYEFGIFDFGSGNESVTLYTNRGSADSPSTYTDQDIVITAIANWSAGLLTLRINGTEVDTTSVSSGNLSANDANYVDYSWGGGNAAGSRIYADLLINRLPTGTEIANNEAWLKARAGIP